MAPTITTAAGVDLSRSHLVGIGGAGMSAIASVLLDRGMQVSGSDAKASHALTALAARGATVTIGQRSENVHLLAGGPTAVIFSTAIRPDNPEMVEAQRCLIPVVRRADALAALMIGHRSVCIAGTHGKTSTTSMLTVALQHSGVDPSFAIGGELNESGTGAHAGSGDIFIAEADESDGSFLAFRPGGAIITTIEPDHLDHHGTAEAYTAAFDEFVARIAPGGFLVAGIDDPGVRSLVARLAARAPSADSSGPARPIPSSLRVITYGRDAGADVRMESITARGHASAVSARLSDGTLVDFVIDAPGEHMAANATAVLAAGMELGIDAGRMAAGLAAFSGVRRRFELVGAVGGVRVFDDYAHHPTEVAATLRAARSVVEAQASAGRVVVVFQPHLYSRTATFAAQFGAALALADVALVLDVYGAREDPVPGVSGALVADAIPPGTEHVFERSMAAVPAAIASLARPGDVVLTMGAGDVTLLGGEIVRELAHRASGDGHPASGGEDQV